MPSKLAASLGPVVPDITGNRHDFDSACHYVWGWQDREDQADSTVAMRFAECWSVYRAAYNAGALTYMSSMRGAWEEFARDGVIRIVSIAGTWEIRPTMLHAEILPIPYTGA